MISIPDGEIYGHGSKNGFMRLYSIHEAINASIDCLLKNEYYWIGEYADGGGHTSPIRSISDFRCNENIAYGDALKEFKDRILPVCLDSFSGDEWLTNFVFECNPKPMMGARFYLTPYCQKEKIEIYSQFFDTFTSHRCQGTAGTFARESLVEAMRNVEELKRIWEQKYAKPRSAK